MGELDGRTAVVTGATAGIGLAVAERLIAEGAFVYVTGRGDEALARAGAQLGPTAAAVRADVTDLEQLDALYRRIASDGREIDVLVANAGGGGLGALSDVTDEMYAGAFDLNVRGALFTVQKALPLLREGASVVLLSSVAATKGSEGFGLYAAAKAAVRSLARTWANELSSRGIRVNVIAPGAVRTPGLRAVVSSDASHADGVLDQMGPAIPLGRVAEPEEIAEVVLFLAGSRSSYLTAATIEVDGGQAQIG